MSTCTSCGGTIEDGYCNVCGLAAAPAPAPSAGTASRVSASGGSGSAGSGSGGSGTAGSGTAGSRRTAGTRGTRGSRRTSGRSARGRLGAGLVEIPPVPYRDPASAILADPQVPESRRFCASCEQPVGRGQDGRAGLTEGFCRNCGTRFSFSPKLETGDLVLLCSDGLTDMVPDDRISAILGTAADPQAACEQLVTAANEQGGKDNVTVVVARFE